jgi:hypothetical protein
MKVFVIVALLCVVPLISGKAVDDVSSKCVVKYLKNKGFLGGKKDETPLEEGCNTAVESAKAARIEEFRKLFDGDDDTKEHVECMINTLKKTVFFDRALIDSLDLTKAKVGKDQVEATHVVAALVSFVQIMRAQKSCAIDTVFDQGFIEIANEAFNEFFEEEEESEADEDELRVDYCIRKHLVDNHLISFNAESFNVNPKNVDVTGVNCDEIYPLFVKAFNEGLAEGFEDDDHEDGESEAEIEAHDKLFHGCFLKKSQDKNFVDNMAQYGYVKELHLSAEQKEQLRLKWVEVFTDVTKSALVCAFPLFH